MFGKTNQQLVTEFKDNRGVDFKNWTTTEHSRKRQQVAERMEIRNRKQPSTSEIDEYVRILDEHFRQLTGAESPSRSDQPSAEPSAEHQDQQHMNNTIPAVETRTYVDGTDIKTLTKDQTIRAIKSNLASIKENEELAAATGSTTIAQDVADRKAANVALLAHLDGVAAPAAAPVA